jgi:GlcNAc-P-P-Und epimerase
LRRILVTGGSGFIGTNLVERYRHDPSTEVLNYDVREPRCAAHADLWQRGDLDGADELFSVMQDFRPTHLIHLAARTDLDGRSMQAYRSNHDGVRVVLGCVGRYGALERSIFASSRLVCDLGEAPTSEYDYFPPNHYGRSKVIGEQLVRAHGPEGGWVIVRPTSIWGPWGRAPYRDFFLSLARGTYVHPAHEAISKHYGYVGNTVFQLDRLLTAPAERVHGRTFYLADPPIDVWAFAVAIRRTLGRSAPRSVPVPLMQILATSGDALKAAGLTEPPITSSRLRNLRTTMLFDMNEIDVIVGPLPFTMQDGIDRTVAHLWEQSDLPDSTAVRAVGERIYGGADPPFR